MALDMGKLAQLNPVKSREAFTPEGSERHGMLGDATIELMSLVETLNHLGNAIERDLDRLLGGENIGSDTHSNQQAGVQQAGVRLPASARIGDLNLAITRLASVVQLVGTQAARLSML